MQRCDWCNGDALYERYHDEEWGVPEFDPQELFERLVLEGMQAGLSWITVLKKRDHMRKRFYGFSVDKLSNAPANVVDDWLTDAGLIRHRGKIEAMIENARLMQSTDDFAEWLWSFAPPDSADRTDMASVPAVTEESKSMSKALKKKGFRFVGPTTCYAFMQSVGMVNDHVVGCFRQSACGKQLAEALRNR